MLLFYPPSHCQPTPYFRHDCRRVEFLRQETVGYLSVRQILLSLEHSEKTIDITVTLTFIHTMDQSTPLNPSIQSTLVDKRPGLISRLRSTFSWWTYFAKQIEEIGNIDTLAPLFLSSSMIIFQPRSCR